MKTARGRFNKCFCKSRYSLVTHITEFVVFLTIKVDHTPPQTFRALRVYGCRAWESHLTEAGFLVQDHVAEDMNAIKDAMGLPADSTSCHTASLAGYVVEGHVPAASIERMLAESPEIKGLAAPGMPMGSPGMEVEGMAADAFAVFSIADNGTMAEFDFYESE